MVFRGANINQTAYYLTYLAKLIPRSRHFQCHFCDVILRLKMAKIILVTNIFAFST